MTIKDIERLTHYGSLAAFIGAVINAFGFFLAISQQPIRYSAALSPIFDCLAFAGLGYGLRKKSRICGSLLSGLLILGEIIHVILAKSLWVLTQSEIWITGFVVMGTLGTFRWHRLLLKSKESSGTQRDRKIDKL